MARLIYGVPLDRQEVLGSALTKMLKAEDGQVRAVWVGVRAPNCYEWNYLVQTSSAIFLTADEKPTWLPSNDDSAKSWQQAIELVWPAPGQHSDENSSGPELPSVLQGNLERGGAQSPGPQSSRLGPELNPSRLDRALGGTRRTDQPDGFKQALLQEGLSDLEKIVVKLKKLLVGSS
jgi:hypothetical protein